MDRVKTVDMENYERAKVVARHVLENLVGYPMYSTARRFAREQDVDYLARVLLRAQHDGVDSVTEKGGYVPCG